MLQELACERWQHDAGHDLETGLWRVARDLRVAGQTAHAISALALGSRAAPAEVCGGTGEQGGLSRLHDPDLRVVG